MTINIQPPIPIAPRLENDPVVRQHDLDLQIMYEAIKDLQARVAALESAP